MRARHGTFFVLTIAAATGAWACGGHQPLFSASGTGGASSSSTEGTGAATTVGSGGASVGSTGGATATSTTGATTTGPTTTGASTGTSSGGQYPASFPPAPQVISGGGPVLTSPKIYPVFFPGDDPATVAALTDFSQKVGTTAYWTATTSEYGVGPATGEPAIMLAEAAPGTIDDTAVQTWLAQKFAAGAPFPQPDENTLVILYYPAGTTITLQGMTSCQTFGGYHNSATVNGQQIAYAVVPRCDGTVDTATKAASHELIEASTDPHPDVDPAYVQVDSEDFYWQILLLGGEVGDMCAQLPNVFTTFPPLAYTVQRTWSNAAAAAGRDPCVPELPGEVYFNAAPVLSDMAMLTVQGQSFPVKTVQIPVGGTATIPVDLYSDGPTGAWTVQGVDPAPMLGSPQLLDLGVAPATGVNGDVAMLTIHVIQAGPGNVELFYVTSTLGSQSGVWIGLVSN